MKKNFSELVYFFAASAKIYLHLDAINFNSYVLFFSVGKIQEASNSLRQKLGGDRKQDGLYKFKKILYDFLGWRGLKILTSSSYNSSCELKYWNKH